METLYNRDEMHRIVNALPRDYKVPFSMHVSGFKSREIAERLGLPLGTVTVSYTHLDVYKRQGVDDAVGDVLSCLSGGVDGAADGGYFHEVGACARYDCYSHCRSW